LKYTVYINVGERLVKMGQCSSAEKNIAQIHSRLYDEMTKEETCAYKQLYIFTDKHRELTSMKVTSLKLDLNASTPEYLECYRMCCHALSEHDKAMHAIICYKKQLRELHNIPDDDVKIHKTKHVYTMEEMYAILQEDSP